jgi:hypothetical protein
MLDCTNEEIIQALQEFEGPPIELSRKIMKHKRFKLMIHNILAFSIIKDNYTTGLITDYMVIALIVGIKIGRSQIMGEMLDNFVKE